MFFLSVRLKYIKNKHLNKGVVFKLLASSCNRMSETKNLNHYELPSSKLNAQQWKESVSITEHTHSAMDTDPANYRKLSFLDVCRMTAER